MRLPLDIRVYLSDNRKFWVVEERSHGGHLLARKEWSTTQQGSMDSAVQYCQERKRMLLGL
jgi:hypothetical protein